MSQSFFARRTFTIILVAVFLLPLLAMGVRRAMMTNRNDVKDWLPGDFPETKTHRWFQGHFPHEQFVLVSWEGHAEDDRGCTLEDQRLEMLARKLEDFDPNLEDLGITGEVAKRLESAGLVTRRAIEQCGDLAVIEGIDAEEAAEVAKAIRTWASPFKKPVLTGRRLIDELQARYPELTRQQALKRLEGSLIGEDHEKTCLVVTLSSASKGRALRGTLEKIRRVAKECDIGPDELHMGGPPVDNVAIDVEGERTLYRLAILSAVVGLGISWLCFRSFRLTFLVFFCALLAAGIGMASVYFTGVMLTLMGLESVASSYATVDAILLSMPSLVYVLAISGAVHIINYYHDSVREHGLQRAPERALAHGWIPCTLAAVTTALGLGSLMASHLVPINKFGLYSAWGVLATLALLFLILPACLHCFPSRQYVLGGEKNRDGNPEKSIFVRFWHTVGKVIIGHNLLVAAGCLLVMAVFILGLTGSETLGLKGVQTSVKLMKLFDSKARIIDDYGWLEKHLGPLVPMEVVIRVDGARCRLNTVQRMRMARDVEHAVEKQLEQEIGGALSAATFAPPIGRTARTAKARLGFNPRDSVTSRYLEDSRDEMRDYLQIDKHKAIVHEGWDPTLGELGIIGEIAKPLEAEELSTLSSIEEYDNLEAIQGLGPEGAAKVKGIIEAWRFAHRDPTLEDLEISEEVAQLLRAEKLSTLRSIEQYCGSRSAKESIQKKLKSVEGIGPEQAAEVAATIDKWRSDHGQELWRVSARVEALGDLDYSVFVHTLKDKVEKILNEKYRELSASDLAAGATPVEGIDVVYTGLVPLVYKAQHELMNGLYSSLKWAFVLIALVMMMVLRSPTAGLLAMVPNIFPVVVIFGAMGWLGILVDVGTMMTASVALGVAVDDTVHFLTWFRRGLDEGHDRKGAVMLAYERCGTAMTQTTLIGGLGLAVFAFSTFTPTQRFGVLMLTLLAAALFGDLVFLPAVLSSPIGRFFRTRKKKPSGKPPRDEAFEQPAAGGGAIAAHIPSTSSSRSTRRDAPHRSRRRS